MPELAKPAQQELLSEFARFATVDQRREFLVKHSDLLCADSVKFLADLVLEKIRSDVNQALHLAEAGLLIAEQLHRDEDLAVATRAKANALYAAGDNRASVEHHSRAIAIYEALHHPKEAARTLSASIQPLILLGEYDRAFAASERARAIFEQTGETRRIANLENNVGNIFHRQDRFEEAMLHYERAYQTLSQFEDWERAAITLHNMAMCLISLNEFAKSLDCYQRARELCVRHNMPRLRDQADYNIAYLYYFRGEYSRAIEMLFATRRACETSGDAYHFALCHLDLSEIYLELNLSEEAREMAHEGFQQFQKLGMGYESAKTLANEAMAYGQQGKAVQALELFGKAREMFAAEKNLVWPWLLDLYQALLLFHEGRHFEARRLAFAAAKFFDSSALRGKAALTHLLLARIALSVNDPVSAHFETSAALENIAGLQTPVLAYQAHFLSGQLAQAREDRAAALSAYQEARKCLEALRSRLYAEELKISFVKNRLQVYEALVDLYSADAADSASSPSQNSAAEAFSCIEAAKSRSMTEMIFQSGQSLPLGDSGQSELVRRIRDLREELNWYYHRIEIEQLRPEENSGARLQQLQEKAVSQENELLRTLRELPAHERENATLEAPADFSLEKIQAAIPADASLIEYYSSGDRLLAAIVTRKSVHITPVTLLSRVVNFLHLLRFQLSKFRMGAAYIQRFEQPLLAATQSHLESLHKELIAPIAARLTTKHLIFVPHGPLHFLPFHALKSGGAYLCDRHTVSYAPSATVFALCQEKALAGRGTIHRALAPSTGAATGTRPDPASARRRQGSNPGSCTSSASSASSNSFTSLILGVPDERAPQILDEVQSVAAILPNAVIFLRDAATTDLLRTRGAETDLLHVATHGNYRQDNPMFSGIRLGDGYLNLYDLYQMRLSARHVTLSGCATGMNFVAAGDELLGLQRGLFCAGASSLLLSLWDVHDQTTSQLMQLFYRLFITSNDMPRALQLTMQTLRDQHPHPYYWAPFILIGALPL
jgi:CHAT domain-containing protein/tetratricopeptide (TPR) repeat protein